MSVEQPLFLFIPLSVFYLFVNNYNHIPRIKAGVLTPLITSIMIAPYSENPELLKHMQNIYSTTLKMESEGRHMEKPYQTNSNTC